MYRVVRLIVAAAVVGAVSSFTGAADVRAVTIDFDDLSDGVGVGTQYAGVEFSLAGGGSPIASIIGVNTSSPPNALINASALSLVAVDDIQVSFDSPVNNVNFRFSGVNVDFPVTVAHVGGVANVFGLFSR